MFHSFKVLAVALFAVGASLAADPVASDAERLRESLAKWEKARDASGGEYTYTVRWSSAFGFGHTTTITVRDKKVVERKFEKFDRETPVPKLAWAESGKDIGSHKTEGAPALTVDELYTEATKLIEMKVPDGHRRYIGFDKEGLLNYCFTVDTRIADDAPRKGIPPFQIQLKPKK